MTFKGFFFSIFSFGTHFWRRKTIFRSILILGRQFRYLLKVFFFYFRMAAICMQTKTALRTIFFSEGSLNKLQNKTASLFCPKLSNTCDFDTWLHRSI